MYFCNTVHFLIILLNRGLAWGRSFDIFQCFGPEWLFFMDPDSGLEEGLIQFKKQFLEICIRDVFSCLRGMWGEKGKSAS